MAFGVVVGVVVNLLVFPPLYLKRASARLSALRDAAGARLDDLADAVERSEIDEGDLDRRMDELASAVSAAAAEVREAAASKRGNPRGRRRGAEQAENADRLRALERTVFFIRDLADVLARPVQESAADTPVAEQLAEAIRRCSDLVTEPIGSPEAAPKLRTATAAVEALTQTVDAQPGEHPSGAAEALTAVVCLRRIIDASRPFI
jgi:methyl-accepting chemotaxis protein